MLTISNIFIGVLSFVTVFSSGESTAQTKTVSPITIKMIKSRKGFATFTNKNHPDNRIGYRFHEHTPLVHGAVPENAEAASIDAARTDHLEEEYRGRKDVVSYRKKIKDEKGWISQTWTFYLAPASDGIDLLLTVQTYDHGLPEYYGVQQCFRMSGETNPSEWRKEIACTPAFSEYDHWESTPEGRSLTSLTYVVRDGAWTAVPSDKLSLGARTPFGVEIDRERYRGELPEKIGAYQARMLDDVGCGLITRSDLDGNWISGLFWEGTSHITDHHPADCLHAIVNVGNIPPNQKKAIRGKIYWFNGSKADLLNHFLRDFPDEFCGTVPLRVAAGQFRLEPDLNANLEHIITMMKDAAGKGADLIVFPECALTGYPPRNINSLDYIDQKRSEHALGDITSLCRDLNIAVALGTGWKDELDQWKNRSFFIDEHGDIIGHYDKIQQTGHERKFFMDGRNLPILYWRGLRVGMLICMDMRFPELWRLMRKDGVGLMLHMAAAYGGSEWKVPVLEGTMRTRAAENGYYIVSCNNAGPIPMMTSGIYNPRGLMLAKANYANEELIIHDIVVGPPDGFVDFKDEVYMLKRGGK